MQIPVHSPVTLPQEPLMQYSSTQTVTLPQDPTHAKFLSTQPVTLPQGPHMQVLVHSTSDITSGSTHANSCPLNQ